jgi:hypothetical protein
MAAQVAMVSRSRDDSYRRGDDEDPLDKVLKGLSIAQGVFGIASNIQNIQAAKDAKAAKSAEAEQAKTTLARKESGKYTEPEYEQTLGSGKFVEIEAPKEGEKMPTGVLRRTVIGPEGERSVLLRQVRPVEMEAKTGAIQATEQAKAEKKSETETKREEASKLAEQVRKSRESARAGERADKIGREDQRRLQSAYDADPTTKESKQIASSWSRVQGAFKEPSAAGDLSLIFGYMKMLDPGSTVREGEFANAQNAGGIPDRVQAQYNRIASGERLSEGQRADFFKQAQNVVKGQFERQRDIDEQFRQSGGKNLRYVTPMKFEQEQQEQQKPRISNSMIKGNKPMKASQLPPIQ